MGGIELQIQRMTEYDYSGLATNKTSNADLLAEIDASQYREGALEVLVKAGCVIPTNAAITVAVSPIARTEAEPSKVFASGSMIATVSIDRARNALTVPTLVVDELDANFGGTIGVYVAGSRGSNTGTIKATFETRLTLKR